MAEGEILELPLDLAHAETVGERRVDVERFLCDGAAAFRAQRAERLHVVEAVRQLDQHHADVLGRRNEHLAQALGLAVVGQPRGAVLVFHEVHAGQLRNAVHQQRDILAELLAELVDRYAAVLDDVVQQRGRDGRGVQGELGQIQRRAHRVLDVGRA